MPVIQHREVAEGIQNYVKTLVTWDKCMSKNYCKIPVIVGIVLGALILFSVLWCLMRCICCGYACCTCCCGGCGGRREKEARLPIQPPGPLIVRPLASDHAAPQFAYYTRSEDALPVMPSLEKSDVKVQVREHVESVEMHPVRSPSANTDYTDLQPPNAMRRQSSGSSIYSAAPYQSQSKPLYAPQAGFGGPRGQRNTVQRVYGGEVPLNPYQYQGPRQEEQYAGGPGPRKQEWSVI